MNREDLRNFIKLCKEEKLDLITTIENEFKNNISVENISSKYNIPIEEIKGTKNIFEFSEDSLTDIYEKYWSIKKKGGNPKFSMPKIKFGSMKNKMGQHFSNTKKKAHGNINQHIQQHKNLAKKKFNQELEDVTTGTTTGMFGWLWGSSQQPLTQPHEQKEENDEHELNEHFDKQSNKINNNSEILLEINNNIKNLNSKIMQIDNKTSNLEINIKKNMKNLTSEILDGIQKTLDELMEDKVYPEFKNIISKEFNVFTENIQHGGKNKTKEEKIICKCCDCARDGYIFTENEDNEKCS